MRYGLLIRDWLARLGVLYTRAADPWPGTEWITSLRIRILRYLVRRYSAPGSRPAAAPDEDLAPAPPAGLPTYCIVDDPVETPPRRSGDLARLLTEIRALNRPIETWFGRVVRRWRSRSNGNGSPA